jgi:hypothetical protein
MYDRENRFQMSSSSKINVDHDIEENIAYKPGTFRYQDLPTDQRKKLFDDRQKELNPCLKVRSAFVFYFISNPKNKLVLFCM